LVSIYFEPSLKKYSFGVCFVETRHIGVTNSGLFAPMILEKAVVDFLRFFSALLLLIAVYMFFLA